MVITNHEDGAAVANEEEEESEESANRRDSLEPSYNSVVRGKGNIYRHSLKGLHMVGMITLVSMCMLLLNSLRP